MKIIITFLSIVLYTNALTLVLNSAKENNIPYATLHIKDTKPIPCETQDAPYNKKLYLCMFDGVLENKIDTKKTPFVDIDFVVKDEKFFIYIKPKFYSRMINVDTKLYEKNTTPLPNYNNAKHWTIIIYKKDPFSKGESNTNGLNFPVTYLDSKYPSVGALDLNGAPINYVQSNDINLYLDVKKLYKKKRYEDVVMQTQKAVANYPQSIFLSEFLLYKIKAIDKILDDPESRSEYDKNDIINEAKRWTKTFTANENMPEVLMLIAKSYLDMGFYSDANYFLDILMSEHPKSNYTQKAILLYADTLYKGNKKDQAIKLYEDVLYASKDLDTASAAAMRLVKNSLSKGKVEKAKEFLTKILNANEDFVFQDKKMAYDLAKKLADKKLYSNAANIANILLKKTKKTDEEYEMLLKDAGLWHERAQEINKAYTYLKRYQKEFQYGEYSALVQQALDRLFFELSETNETKLVNYYDQLIEKYDNDIGYKALLAKARLLLSQKQYDKVLSMHETLMGDTNSTQAKEVLDDAAFWAVNNAINEDNCIEAVSLLGAYSDVEKKIQNKKALFECYIRLSRNKKAEELALKHVNAKDLNEKLEWMINLSHAFFVQKEWRKNVDLSQDVEILGNILKNDKANEALYDRFFALMHLGEYEKAMDVARKIEKVMPENYKNVEVYERIVKMAKEQGNDLVLIANAKKAVDLQKKSEVYLLTPSLEYDYIASLQKLGRNKEALDVALLMLNKDLNKNQRGRVLYTIAEAYAKISDDIKAKDYFQKCVEFDENGTWGNICKENLNIVDQNSTN